MGQGPALRSRTTRDSTSPRPKIHVMGRVGARASTIPIRTSDNQSVTPKKRTNLNGPNFPSVCPKKSILNFLTQSVFSYPVESTMSQASSQTQGQGYIINPPVVSARLRQAGRQQNKDAGSSSAPEQIIEQCLKADDVTSVQVGDAIITNNNKLKYPLLFGTETSPAAADRSVAVARAKLLEVKPLNFGGRITNKAVWEIKDDGGKALFGRIREEIVNSVDKLGVRPDEVDEMLKYYFYHDKIDSWLPTRSGQVDITKFTFTVNKENPAVADHQLNDKDFAAGLEGVVGFAISDLNVNNSRLNVNVSLKMVEVDKLPPPQKVMKSPFSTAAEAKAVANKAPGGAPSKSEASVETKDPPALEKQKERGEEPVSKKARTSRPAPGDFPVDDAPAMMEA